MRLINVKIRGIAPLLQNRFPVEEHGENKKTAKKKVYDAIKDAERACYRGKDGMIYQPSEHIFGAMIKAGTQFRFEGKKTYKEIVKGGVIIEPEFIPLNTMKWDEIDARRVVVGRASVVRWRPKFNEWELEFIIRILDDENIDPVALKDILEKAGASQGIGDYRPRFGRFQVVGWEEVAQT